MHHSAIDACTACASCVVECPVTRATRQFRGPKLLGPGLERFRLFEEDMETSIDYCSNCKTCDITCPANVPVATLNMLAKEELYRRRGHSLRDWMLSHGELFARLGSPMAPLTNFMLSLPLTRAVLSGLGLAQRALPAYDSISFYRRFRAFAQERYTRKVVFFPGCYIGYNTPRVGMELVEILQACHIEVIVPDVVCCGTPIVANGYMERARQKATANISVLAPYAAKGIPILTACTSCGLMLKQEYQELFDLPGAETVARQHYDAGEFLLEVADIPLSAPIGPASSYLYHAPCHLRSQGIGLPGLELLQRLKGLDIRSADAGCCGIAGSYGFKKDKYAVAQTIGAGLFAAVAQHPGAIAVSECGTCQWQITQTTGRTALHPLSVLRQYLRTGE